MGPTRARRALCCVLAATVAAVVVPAVAWAKFTKASNAAEPVSTATLAAPTNLSASALATLTWTATSSTFATGTRVFRSTTTGGPYTQIAQVVGPATTFIDSPGPGTFHYVVKAYYSGNGANWTSPKSNQATAVVTVCDGSC